MTRKYETNQIVTILRITFAIVCLKFTAIGIGQMEGHRDDRPNIVFILTDDLGFNQIGAYGETPIKTPNLDRLASGGIVFTNAYSGSTVCSPSRVSLFTGRDGRLLHDNSNKVRLREVDVTIGHLMKYAGYDTGYFGKYSIGSEVGLTDPLAIGFDTWYGMFGILEGHRQYPHILWRDNVKERIEANEAGKKGAYAQELFTDEAIGFIEKQRENPFFVFLAYSSPHAELAAPEEFLDLYRDQFTEDPYLGMSTGQPDGKYASYYPDPVDEPNATMAAMVTALDEYVGRIYAALERCGVADNTLIVFTSDNGPHGEGGASPEYFEASKPYRGMKRDVYDGGIHVPMIAHWPGAVAQPRVDETPFAFADFLPTFADLVEVELWRLPRLESNGVSIAGLLDDDPKEMPERVLYWEFALQAGDPNSGIIGDVYQAARKGAWKAVRYGVKSEVELYDLEKDPGENLDLAGSNSEIKREFEMLFDENLEK